MKKLLVLFVILFSLIGLSSCDQEANGPTGSDATNNNTSDNNENNNQNGNTEQGDGNTDEAPVTLSAPLDVEFDYETGMLSWGKVAYSTAYVVNVNGKEYTATTNSIYLPIEDKTSNIKVKATAGSSASEWSKEITY